jgi:hypothetical protein
LIQTIKLKPNKVLIFKVFVVNLFQFYTKRHVIYVGIILIRNHKILSQNNIALIKHSGFSTNDKELIQDILSVRFDLIKYLNKIRKSFSFFVLNDIV